ncbi:MAG: helix-turn-helix domain-containing protein [Nitrososphaerota archaeon]|nr:helix-turn-helix domain-containing protein [Nitrososphaerota archaeon]
MLEVRLAIDNPENWVRHMAESARVKIMRIKRRRGTVEDLVELSSEHSSPEELIAHLRKEAGVVYSDMTKVDRNRAVGMVSTHDCPICSTFAGLNTFLISADTRGDGRMEWRLFVGGDTDLKTLCGRLDKRRVRYDILEVSRHAHRKNATARQEEILRVALDLGYFDFPKRIRLEELAEKLHITPGTLSEILRRAERNVLSSHFGVGED